MMTVGIRLGCAAPLFVLALVVNPATWVASAMANEFGIAIWGGRAGIGSRFVTPWIPSTVALTESALPFVASQRRMSFPASCTAPPPTVTTTSASAAYASSHAASSPSSPPPMPMLVHSGAASSPFNCKISISFSLFPSMNLREDLLARTNTFLLPNVDNSSMVVERKGEPMCTAFMPSGMCSGGMDRAVILIAVVVLRRLVVVVAGGLEKA
mmetsp:Transcript_19029/g.21790  ORF Transcript_19029/g.21790 Transcript_19029/m.21790 type:complete len:212 (+) Transcript_19029:81-716(+)